ncbi:right-handed parallel beta-helix repeat-containing protein [Halomarina rubra]|uniref:Right-handed parallel beta-helix repeat-containing protein n=1 Tax=Halomarina rubra TaxID=2071873 RepID=A0ABD6AXZ5_9EURY|nr:right-handed parallel beta-helix repeat-containing protein [Halomarina rubra]
MSIRTPLVACVFVLVVATGSVVGTISTPIGYSSSSTQTEATLLTECTTITTSGTYTLTQDIGPVTGNGPCLRVDANEVTLDGNGYTIDGDIRVGDTDRTEFYRGLALRNVSAGIVAGEALYDLTVSSSDLNGGIGALFFENVTVTDSRLGGSGIIFDEQGTDIVVENSTFDGEEGIALFERVQNARLVNNVFELTGHTERAESYAVFLSSTSGTTRDVLVTDNRIDGAGGAGIVVSEGGVDIDVLRNNITNASVGIEYLAAGGTVAENDISYNDVGIGLYAVEPVDSVIDVLVRNNRIIDNRVGVFSESIVETDGLQVHDNLIAGNSEFGVNNIGQSLIDARNNDWGNASGPSSAPANDSEAPFADPVTGTLANGSGDAVSEGDTPGVSNVRFDPVTGADTPIVPEPEPKPEPEPESTFYQVDFVTGPVIETFGAADSDEFYSDQSRLVGFLHGSDGDIDRTGRPSTLDEKVAACVAINGYDLSNDTVTVRFTVTEDCNLNLTLVSYEKPGAGWSRASASDQQLVDASGGSFGTGTHELAVSLPTANGTKVTVER